MSKSLTFGNWEIYIGWRDYFHVELGVGAWNQDGYSVWINLLWAYIDVRYYV